MKDGVILLSPEPSKGMMKGAKGWSDPPELSADPGHPAGNSQETPELADRGKKKETSWENRIPQEEGQGHSGCKAPAHPLLHNTTQAPRSRSGRTHSLAEYMDKLQELWIQQLQKPFWLMRMPKFLPRGHSGHHTSGRSWDLCQAGNSASSAVGTL